MDDDVRLHPADEADLRWFFNPGAEIDGVRSSFGAFYEHMRLGAAIPTTAPDEDDHTDRKIAASRRRDRIGRTLARMPKVHVRTLQRFLAERQYDAERARVFRAHVGLVPVGIDLTDDIAVLRAIGDAKRLLTKAIREYEQAKPRRCA